MNDGRDRLQPWRNIPLATVLRAVGAAPDRQDPAKWHTAQGVLSITGVKFFNWSQGCGGGGAIDLAMHLNRLEFKAALVWLQQRFPPFNPSTPRSAPHHPPLILPPPNIDQLGLVQRYLLAVRRLPHALIQPLIQAGRLYADHRANAVFLLLDHKQHPVGAELRGTTPYPWHSLVPGSRKDQGYFATLTPAFQAIVLCESAIDALSCTALHPQYLCLSTAGARPNPAWLTPLLQQSYPIYCGFDTDPTGDRMAQALIALHPTVKRLRPSRHDWNDVLKAQT